MKRSFLLLILVLFPVISSATHMSASTVESLMVDHKNLCQADSQFPDGYDCWNDAVRNSYLYFADEMKKLGLYYQLIGAKGEIRGGNSYIVDICFNIPASDVDLRKTYYLEYSNGTHLIDKFRSHVTVRECSSEE